MISETLNDFEEILTAVFWENASIKGISFLKSYDLQKTTAKNVINNYI